VSKQTARNIEVESMGVSHRLLVLSDLHAFIGKVEDKSPGLIGLGHGAAEGEKLIESCFNAASEYAGGDLHGVLVAGDLSDRADPDALKLVWKALSDGAHTLDVPLLATAGNHDYDSRGQHHILPRSALLDLEPPFPFGNEESRLSYFAYDFAVIELEELVIVSVNSAAQHGYTLDSENEYDYGRVTSSSVLRIKNALTSIGHLPKKKMLMMHHHPLSLPDIELDDKAVLRGSDHLLAELSQFGEWFVLHGHKHRPWIQNGGGVGPHAVVFSAGSLAVNLGGSEFADYASHQFYIIDFEENAESSSGPLELAGQIRAWTRFRKTWEIAARTDGFPGVSGFGFRPQMHALIDKIEQALKVKNILNSDDLNSIEPALKFMSYTDTERFVGLLRSSASGTFCATDDNGYLTQVALTGGEVL